MKKNLLLLLLATFFNAITNAQINKDAILLGGQLSFSSSNSNADNGTTNVTLGKNRAGNFNISLGKATKTNTIVGVNLGYFSSYSRTGSDTSNAYGKQINNTYSFGLFCRHYKNLAKNLYLFGEGGIDFSRGKTQYSYASNHLYDQINTGGLIYFSPGVSYKICKKMLAEISLNNLANISYNRSKNVSGNNSYTNNGFNISSSLNGGLFNSLSYGFKFML